MTCKQLNCELFGNEKINGTFIKDNGGDIDNFTNEQKLRLAKSLQYCSALPSGELETLPLELKLDLAEVQQNDVHSGVHMCKGVLPKLIIESYFILEKMAQDGDMQAINEFNRSMIPEILEAIMANNLDATLKVATYKRIGKRGFDKDLTSSIGYFLAVKNVYNVSTFDKYIEKMRKEFTIAEFNEAEEFEINLVNQWKNLPDGSVTFIYFANGDEQFFYYSEP